MSVVYEAIQECIGKGTKEKQAIIAGLKDDPDAKEIFRLMLCPSIVYNIKKVTDTNWNVSPVVCKADRELVWAVKLLLGLDRRGAVLKDHIFAIHLGCNTKLQFVFNWILARKNPAKVGKSIVNKVWPDLVRTQRYMGAVPGTEENLERLPWKDGIAVQKKEDGQTGLVDYIDGIPVSMHTRQGNRIDQYFPGFMKSLPEVPGFTGMVHHEILVLNYVVHDMEVMQSRAVGNGLINKQIQNGIVGGDLDGMLRSKILDYVDDSVGLCQDIRYERMLSFVTNVSHRVAQEVVYTLKEAREIAQEYISKGFEGAVCKVRTELFKNGKPWYSVKIKNEFTVDLEVIDWKQHSKQPELLGALLMASSDRLLKVWVNLKCDKDRLMFGDLLMGDILQVKAEAVTSSKSKKERSLSLPRFDGDEYDEYFRHDKSIADTLTGILSQEEASKKGV